MGTSVLFGGMRFQYSLGVLVALCSVCDQRPPVVPHAASAAVQLRSGFAAAAAAANTVDSDDGRAPKAAAIPRDWALAATNGSGSIVEYTYKSLSSYRHDPEAADGGGGGWDGDWFFRNADLFPEVLVAIPSTLQPDEDFPFEDMTDCALIDDDQMMVSCGSAEWTEVLPDTFPDTLHYLRIMGTSIRRLDAEAFGDKDILVLEITENDLSLEVAEDSFANLTGIQQLIIHHNNLSVLSSQGFFTAFRHLVHLDVLDLDYNGLNFNGTGGRPSWLSEPALPSVRHLSLRGNPIGRIQDYFFWDLRESPIVSLNLQSCDISWFGVKAFTYLTTLEHVDIFDNPLFEPTAEPPSIAAFLDMQPFARAMEGMNTEKFRQLSLANTGLARVPTEVLRSRTLALTALNLAQNYISDIGNFAENLQDWDVFPAMKNLTDISLKSNKISDIHVNSFKKLHSLERLDVSRNEFTSLTNGVLHSNLLYLDISYQCHEKPGSDCSDYPFTINSDMFLDNNMEQLRVLKMSGLKVKRAHNATFTGLADLRELYIDDSTYSSISAGTFRDLTKLKKLDMSNNQDLKPLPKGVFEGLDELEILNLGKSDKALRHVNRAGNESYPLGGLGKLRQLLARGAIRYEHPNSWQDKQPLSRALLAQLPSIELLDLSSNSIQFWTGADVFSENKNLSVLYLQSSDIQRLTEQMVSSFRRLTLLNLSDNSIACDEYVVAFYEMVDETPSLQVVGYDGGRGYQCFTVGGVNMTFEEYVLSIPKAPKLGELHLGIIVGALVTLAVFVVAGFYIYRQRYYISYYIVRRGRRKEKRDNEDIRDYDYDVFISYHEEESEWVYQELLPELEQEKPRLRACVRDRDFKVRHFMNVDNQRGKFATHGK